MISGLGIRQKGRRHTMVGLLGGLCCLLSVRILLRHSCWMGAILLVLEGKINSEMTSKFANKHHSFDQTKGGFFSESADAFVISDISSNRQT